MASQRSSWEEKFDSLFDFPSDKWSISEAGIDGLPNIIEVYQRGWKQYQDKGKVSFKCSAGCGKKWSSLNGAVIFHYRLVPRTGVRRRGEVKFWCFGQKCNACRDEYEDPVWPMKEIERSLENLLRKVKEKFYGGPKKDVDGKQLGGNMASGHQRDLCFACEKGLCGRRDESSE